MSGAWIKARLNLSVLSRVILVLDSTARKQETSSLGAYVTRTTRDGFGVEWYELDPPCFSDLLHPHAFSGNVSSAVTEYSNTASVGIELRTDLSLMTDFFEPLPSLRGDSE